MKNNSTEPVMNLRGRVLGVDQLVPLLDGSRVPYVNLDNAASTPPLVDVMEAVGRFMPFTESNPCYATTMCCAWRPSSPARWLTRFAWA